MAAGVTTSTTQSYLNGHRAFIARRRTLRPAAEYRQPTEGHEQH